MVLVFDKKTPENAFNRTKSNRVVGYNTKFMVNFCLNESYSLLLLNLLNLKVLLTVDAQINFLNDFNLKSVQVRQRLNY